MTITQADIDRALKHLGWDDYADFCAWALSNSEMNRFDDLAQAFAAHREAAEKAGAKAMHAAVSAELHKCGEPCPQCHDAIASLDSSQMGGCPPGYRPTEWPRDGFIEEGCVPISRYGAAEARAFEAGAKAMQVKAAGIASVYSSIQVEERDNSLAAGNCEGALTRARQAQTASEIADAIAALDPAQIVGGEP